MKLSEFSVHNSLLVNCLSVFLVVTGFYALLHTEREAFPNFSFDIVTVRTDYLGASPEVVEKRITIPLEKELKEVEDIDEMSSLSIEGMSLVILQIDPDASDVRRTVDDIQKAVDRTDDLPTDLKDKPFVTEMKTKDTPILEISLSGALPEMQLRRLALNLETELLDLDDVSAVVRKGLRDREIWVELDPEKIRENHLSISEVIQALAAQNVNVPGGLLKGKESEWLVRTSGELETAEDVQQVVVRANIGGNWHRVGDLAHVSEQLEEQKILQRTDGTRAINFMIIKKNEADAIRLKKEIDQLLGRFQKKNPPELKLAVVNDFSYYIKRRLRVLVSNGWMGLILVIIPMLLFLSPRVTMGAVLGMPVALLTAFAGMQFFDISINLISMFGMIMVLGMLVDEDIVIAENIARYLEQGKSAREAAIRGAAEVGRAIISTVLTTIIAFLPLLFMTGIFGKFVSDIPKVVMLTLAASLIEALIILPSHLSDLNRGNEVERGYQRRKSHHYFDRFRLLYKRSLTYCLEHSKATTLVALGVTFIFFLYAFLGIRYGLTNTRFILFPAKGVEAFFVRAEAKVGTPLEATEQKMLPLEERVASLPAEELDHYVTQVGITQNDPNDPFTQRGSHLAQIEVFLTPETKRERTADEIMEALRQKFGHTQGFEAIHFDPVQPGPPQGKPVAVRLRGEDFNLLNQIADIYKEELKTIKGVRDIHDDYEEGKGELHVVVDLARASQAALSIADVATTVRQAFEGWPATTIRKTDEEVDVVVRLNEGARHEREVISNLLIPNRWGGLTPLKEVASLQQTPGVTVIKHVDAKRVVTVTANIDQTVTTSSLVNRRLKEKFEDLSKKYPTIGIHYGGEEEDTEESMQSLWRSLFIAVLLIFLVLLVTFGSLVQTIVLLFTIPFGAVGIILGFSLLNEPLSFLALLGIVGLAGVVVDGGTLLFTFINHLENHEGGLKGRIIEACETRLRPILLTTATTVLGVVPAAYGIGGNDPFIRPMALAMNWGLAGSMFFTLYAIPCIYYVIESYLLPLKKRFFS